MAVIFYIKNDVLYLIFYLTLATVVKLPDINLTPSEPYFFSQLVLTVSAPLHRQGGLFSQHEPIVNCCEMLELYRHAHLAGKIDLVW